MAATTPPSDDAPVLPVGVVLPTLQARAELPAHLAALGGWLPRAEQVVVVDGESTDGTLEWLRAHLEHPRRSLLSRPRGLFASWNHAVAHVQSEFVTIATVGDVLEADGVEHLLEVSRRFDADVVISPPRFLAAGGAADEHAWPIHALLRSMRVAEPTLLSPHDALWLQLLFRGYALLGSSASDLYRTACLQARPFPTDCGRSGDAAWCLRHAHAVRIAVTPRVVSTFLLHPRPAPEEGRLQAVLEETIDALLADGGRADLDLARLGRLRRLLRHLAACEARKAGAKAALKGLAAGARLGIRAGRERRRRDRMRALRKRLLASIRSTCREALPGDPPAVDGWL